MRGLCHCRKAACQVAVTKTSRSREKKQVLQPLCLENAMRTKGIRISLMMSQRVYHFPGISYFVSNS